MGLLGVVTITVCVETGALGTVTNLTGLDGVLNWGVPGIGGPGNPVATALTPHPATAAVFCPVTPACTSLGAVFCSSIPCFIQSSP